MPDNVDETLVDQLRGSTDEQIDSLVDQLRNTTAQMQKPNAKPFDLKSEDAEKFVVVKAGELIEQSLELVKQLGPATASTIGDAEGVEALAKLIAASASAIESLNKIIVQDKKSKTAKEVKQMEVNAKLQLEEENKPAKPGELTLKGTREEIFKMVLKEADILEIESAKVEQKESSEESVVTADQ